MSDAFTRARSGQGSFVVLEGAPGVGKSLLLGVARAVAIEEGMDVLAAAGTELERESTFGMALQLFESRVARACEEDRARLLSGAARLAAPLLAEGPRGALPDGQAFSLLHGLYWLCANLAAEKPLVLAIDDAQWVDTPTLRFLLYLAQRVHDLPVCVVVAADSTRGEASGDLLAEIGTHPIAINVQLQPLSPGAVAHQLRQSLFPVAHDAFCRACFKATKGNPFLLGELATELAARQVEPSEWGAERVAEVGPPSVARTVLLRAGRVGLGAEALARAVAVLGDGAELRHAADLAGLDQRESAGASDALREADVLQRHPRLSFVHPIVGRALEAEIAPADRAEAHLRAAEILRHEDIPRERVARHLIHARSSGSRWAIDLLCEAAQLALVRGAPDAAARYLERALAEPPDAELRPRLSLELARAEMMAGKAEAVEHLRQAVDQIDDPRERALTCLEVGRALHAQGRTDDAAAAFERGLTEPHDADQRLRASLVSAQATLARNLPGRSVAITARSVANGASGRATGSERLLAADAAAEHALLGAPREEVLALARRALGRGALLQEETADGLAYYLATFALTVAEELQTAEIALTAAVQEAQSRGSVLGSATAYYHRSLVYLRKGRAEAATADARRAISAERYGWRLALPGARSVLAEVLIERGNLDAASREVWIGARSGCGDEIARNLCLMSRAHVHLLRKEPGKALAEYVACGQRLDEAGVRNPAVVPWRSGAALAARDLGDRAEALRLAQDELQLAEAFGAPGTIGRSLHVLAVVEGGKDGLERLAEAIEVLETSPAALHRARALVDYGSALRRAGQRGASREPLRAGLDLANRCGAEALSKRATEELLAAGGRPRRTAIHGVEALTPRQQQVTELAAKGLSNREIAETLFVTVKTVEWHLHHGYAKLGVQSRRGLVAALASDELALADAQLS